LRAGPSASAGTSINRKPGISGAEKLVYSFQNGADGASPKSPVLNVGGILYGTTASGGSYFNGTVFVITP
jgi:hypothetical protein